MKILNICYDDYANYMYNQTRAMKSVGMDVSAIKLKRHSFGYSYQCSITTDKKIMQEIRKADIVQIFHSCKKSLELISHANPSIPITVWHTGSVFRENPVNITELFSRNNLKKVFTDQCEFLMIDKTMQYVAIAIDTPKMHSNAPNKDKYVLAHYPSKSNVKGTDDILRMMAGLKGSCYFKFSNTLVSHEDQMFRMSKADIYIELFKPELNGRPYGCFGVTAFEAASLGLVVVTQNIHEQAYINVYGECPLIISNTEESFCRNIEKLLFMNREEIEKIKAETLKWVTEKHSMKATGYRIRDLITGLQ